MIVYTFVERNLAPTVNGLGDVVNDVGVRGAGKMFTTAAVAKPEMKGVEASPSFNAAFTVTR